MFDTCSEEFNLPRSSIFNISAPGVLLLFHYIRVIGLALRDSRGSYAARVCWSSWPKAEEYFPA